MHIVHIVRSSAKVTHINRTINNSMMSLSGVIVNVTTIITIFSLLCSLMEEIRGS